MSVEIGIVGGSGVYQLENLKIIQEHDLETPFGKPSAPLVEAELEGVKFVFIPRHGKGHRYNPSEVNYRANIFAMKMMGVKYLLSVSAVGSLKTSAKPGTLYFPNQFIDWTKGLRKRTFFDEGMVGHVSVANPINNELKALVIEGCDELEIAYERGGAYICIEGPQFSSRAESEFYRSMGASIIGMTNVPESYLAQEAGIAYCTIAMVTDYDCWKDEHCTVEEILNVMKVNYQQVNKLLPKVLHKIVSNPPTVIYENEYALITDQSLLNDRHREILETLMAK